MERFCVSHDCHRLGCDVEMVQSDVGEWVRYDDASAENAKLRAEVEAEREESAARLQRFCVPHWDDKNDGRCPLCERDHVASDWSRDRNALIAEKDHLYSVLTATQKERDNARAAAIQSDRDAHAQRVKASHIQEHNILLAAALSAARAALDGERAKCDEAKWFIEYLSATNDGQRADAEAWLFGYRARRAAEAQPKE